MQTTFAAPRRERMADTCALAEPRKGVERTAHGRRVDVATAVADEREVERAWPSSDPELDA